MLAFRGRARWPGVEDWPQSRANPRSGKEKPQTRAASSGPGRAGVAVLLSDPPHRIPRPKANVFVRDARDHYIRRSPIVNATDLDRARA
jgi:hypothetical protein